MELSKTKLNLYASLGTAKMRRRHGLFTVEGEKSVLACLPNFSCEAVIVNDTDVLPPLPGDAPVYTVGEPAMRKLSNLSTHSNIFGVFCIPEESVDNLEVPNGLYLALDGVQDPGNLGTIIRTCHWFGITRIFASHDTADLYNPKTIQSTMGSIGKVEVTYCNLPELFEKNRRMPVYGTLLDGKDIFKETLSANGFIVMGNEGKGLSERVRKCVDHPLLIPPATADHSESLNVAVATAIVIACFRK